MTASAGGPVPYRLSVRRLFWLPLGLSALLVLAVLVALVIVSWRGLARVRPVQAHLAHIARIQDLGLSMEETLLEGLRSARIDPAELERLRREVGQIAILDGHLHPQTRQRLEAVVQRLGRAPADPIEVLFETLAQLRTVLVGEREHHDRLLDKVAEDTEMELRLAITLLVVLPLAGGVLLFLLRARIKNPLDDLGDLLTRLARRDYQPVAESAVESSSTFVQPVFYSYNALVSRCKP